MKLNKIAAIVLAMTAANAAHAIEGGMEATQGWPTAHQTLARTLTQSNLTLQQLNDIGDRFGKHFDSIDEARSYSAYAPYAAVPPSMPAPGVSAPSNTTAPVTVLSEAQIDKKIDSASLALKTQIQPQINTIRGDVVTVLRATAQNYQDQNAAIAYQTLNNDHQQQSIDNLDSFTTALNGTVQKQAIENIGRDDAISKNADAITDVKTVVSANTRGVVAATDAAQKAQATADTGVKAAATAQSTADAGVKAAATAQSTADQNTAQIHNLDSFTTALNGTVQKQAIENIGRDDAISKNTDAITDVKTVVSANTRGVVAATDAAQKAQATADTGVKAAATAQSTADQNTAQIHNLDSFSTALNGTVQKQAIENIGRDTAISKNADAINDVQTQVNVNGKGIVVATDAAHKAQNTADTALTATTVNKTAIETVKASAHDGDRLAKMNAAASNAQAKVYADQKAAEVEATEQPQISKMAATEQQHYNTLAVTEQQHFTALQTGVKQVQDTGAYAQKRAADAQAYAEANRQALIDTNARVAQNTADLQAQGQQQAAFEAQTNQKFSNIDKKIDNVEKKAMRGIAGANALAGLPQLNQDDTFGVAAAVGGYEGESAIAVGASAHPFESKAVTVKAGVTATNGAMGWNAGVGYSFR
ncbi:YadA-like family protein [uncultured Leclercia sp.]|uniref:YadA-like family protein n=1 Tax=uncultured Leclercia sp. TaxID=332959 RepID=UPI002598AE03|nr:YadA-like family protein [uncultured Leclercia sp.]